jgi:hypothetical protein
VIQPPEVGLALMLAFLPVTSALGYELSSNSWYVEHQGSVNVVPVAGDRGRGGLAAFSFRF